MSAVEQFRDAIAAAGLRPPDMVIADGKLHRFPTNGRGGDDAGWYVLYGDDLPAGAYGDWRTGVSETWHADAGRRRTSAEEAAHRARLEEIRRTREAEEVRQRAEAREHAATIWNAATPATDDHPYLTRKQVRAHGLRVHADGRLIVPMRDNGELNSLQFIEGNGDKLFLAGGRVKGCYHTIGTLDGAAALCDGAAALCVVEGYATGAAIHAATDYPVAVAFNAGNLAAVVKAIRARHPELRLILCADDDIGTNGNPGLTKATEAARTVGGLLAVPDFGTDRPAKATDFNDLMQHRGVEAVAEAIMHARPVDDDDMKTEKDNRRDPWAHAQTATELLSEPDSRVKFLDVLGILVLGCITELFSPRGLGKTHIAWALAVWLARQGLRILYLDRDNSRYEVKRRLRAWGGDGCDTLKTLTREKAPALTDAMAWATFPIADYDVVIVDSFDAAAEGVGEQDSTKPSKAIAALLDVARATDGPAILILGNVIKSGAHSRGSGVIEDRADIVFEVRDATDLKPTGTKAWWEELPPAGRHDWAQRATRRKKRDRYRLALVPSKYRVGEEPDPLALEIDLSAEPWRLRNVTAQLVEMGETSQREATEAGQKRLDAAAEALRQAFTDRTSLPMNDEVIPLLMTRGLKRAEARVLIQQHVGRLWRLDPPVGRRGVPVCLVPMLPEKKEDSAGMQRVCDKFVGN